MAGGHGLDPEDGAAVLRGEIRRILGGQTPEELLRALTGKELQDMLAEAHTKARLQASSADIFSPLPRVAGEAGQALPKGLANLGNTCYLGSILQCLAQTGSFTQELADHESQLGRIGCQLNVVLGKLQSAEPEQPSVEAVLGELASRYSWYQGKSQQDAHELLRTLLGALADERELPEDRESLQQVVQKSFQGQLCEAIVCWSCRQISLRHEDFLDLSLDIAAGDDDPGPLGLHSWIMRPPQEEGPEEAPAPDAEAAASAEPELAEDAFNSAVVEVQLERVPGRRIALGLDWEDALQHGCKVLRRIVHSSMVDTWNKRQSHERRVGPGLLLLSVNGKEDQGEMMQVLKDEQRLLLRFAPAEAVAARASLAAAQGFRVELARDSKAPWGLQLDKSFLENVLVVARVLPDSILDSWNLRCQATDRRALVVRAGDRVLEIAGSEDAEEMSNALADPTRRKLALLLERGDAKTISNLQPDGPEEDADAVFEVELQPIPGTKTWGWGFQLDTAGEGPVVKSILEGSPLAMWNIVCRSRGEEHLCVESGDTLLEPAEVEMPVSSSSQKIRLQRSKERQASVRALDAAAMVATQRKQPSPDLEEKRKTMLEAATSCAAALPSAMGRFFAATPRPAAATLADCLRNLGSIEALEEDFAPIYNCVHCSSSEKGRRRFASKRAWLKPPLPPVVPVQLKRFHCQHGSYYKSRTKIKTTSTLDLSSLILTPAEQQELQPFVKSGSCLQAEAEDSSAVYELYAVCAHLGGSMERGHYVAFVNTGPSLEEEAWFLLDDARAMPCQREDALLVEAYIAFYRRPSAARRPS